MVNVKRAFLYLHCTVIQFSPDISSGSEPYVHHILVYICDGLQEEDLGKGGDCDTSISERVGRCLGSLLIAAWAVGGSVRYFQ